MKIQTVLRNEQGIALVMALIVMVTLAALIGVLAMLATSEPQIADNQLPSAQARALAESGLQRALWALSTGQTSPSTSGVLALDANYNLPSPVPSPYDGSMFVSVSSIGGFKVTVTSGAQANEKIVTAVGFVPDATSPRAIKKVTAVVTRIKWIDPICALCAGGENPPGTTTQVQVGGSATVNGTASTQGHGGNAAPAGAFCSGVTPTSDVASTGTVSVNGSPNLYAPPGGSATMNNASFPSGMLLSDSDMSVLKSLAKAKGTYYRGNQTWTSPPASGIIFVDTTDGSVLTASTPAANVPVVDIHGNWNSGWSGWLIVAGTIHISGETPMTGLIYAQNDVTLNGTGNGTIQGAIITTNRIDTASTTVDSNDIGNAPLTYNCPDVRNGGSKLSQNWFVKPGTYREVPGQ